MKEERFLEYVSSYRDGRPQSDKRLLFWVALAIHAAALAALIVFPLAQVDRNLPRFESVAAFLVSPPSASPPPDPPPPSAQPNAGGSPSRARSRLLEASFIAPVAVPLAVAGEDQGVFEFGVPGGLEGGIPGGVVSGIVGGLEEAPAAPGAAPVRLDFRREEARPLTRVEPDYPALAVQARVEGIVILEVLVDSRGVPSTVNVLRSIPLLESSAIEAVRQWRWRPCRHLDRPVPFWVTVTVNFRLT
jgi:protein TonB